MARAYYQRVILPDQPAPAAAVCLQKLTNDIGKVPWSYLRPHQEAGNLYFVDHALNLAVVGAAVSGNDVTQVKAWLGAGDLVKIESIHAAQWTDAALEFETLLVSPFVLCRPL